MGEVYRARDTRLERSVAIKVICLALVDPDKLRRFEQEARSIAALNHPNILAIYDTGVHDGNPFLVTELLEGETLRERLSHGPLPVRKVVEIGSQVAHGLAAAHERGIIHRDLKPENIFLTNDGHAKLLDFGLAKAQADAATSGSSMSQVLTASHSGAAQTSPGMVMGTAPYMAPEQVRGEKVDHRCDIFSFGAVLYEMLSGKRAFSGPSSVETMSAVLNAEPPEIDPNIKIPAGLERIVRHCLEKNPADRFQSARDLTFALGALSGSELTRALPGRPAKTWPRWLMFAAGAALLLAVAALGYLIRRPAANADRLEFTIPPAGEVTHLALSPDGAMLAYVSPDDVSGEGMIYVQRVGKLTAAALNGTEGATYPFWSPDDSYVAFFAAGKLKKVAVSGGAPQVIANVVSARGGSWGKKDVIIYAPGAAGPLWRVNADGTDAQPLTDKVATVNEPSHRWPLFLPDGDHFFFWAGNFNESRDDRVSGIYVSSLAVKEKKLVVLTRSNPGFADGNVFYVDGKYSLLAAAVNEKNGNLVGRPHVVLNQVGFQPSTYWSAYTAAGNGTVVYHLNTAMPTSRLTWYDRSGKELGHVGEIGILSNPTLSPDGTRVAVDVSDAKAKNIDVWTYDLARGTSERFTFDPAEETTGVWSRDGSKLAFRSAAPGGVLRVRSANGLGSEGTIVNGDYGGFDLLPNSWVQEDKQVLATRQLGSGGSNLVLVSVAGKTITPLSLGKGSEKNGQISPDGKWLAYASNETGDWEVYVTTFPTPGGKWQVSRGGGSEPRWRNDGNEIFYVGPKGELTSVSVDTRNGFSCGTPLPLFQLQARSPVSSTDLYTYDVAADGKRFLVNRYVKPVTIPPLNILLNSLAAGQ